MTIRPTFLFLSLLVLAVPSRAQQPSPTSDSPSIVHAEDSLRHHDVADPPRQLFEANPDWEAFYADATARSLTRIRVDEWPAPIVYGLMLSPGTVYVEGFGDDILTTIEAFRRRHPAISTGEHLQLVNASYAFQRSMGRGDRGDRVVVVLDADGKTTVNVSRVFADDVLLRDAMTDQTALVSFGIASFDAHPSGLILIEEAP